MAEARLFHQEDCNLDYLKGKTVAVIGFGSQGHAHALNLKESGVDVVVGLYDGSKSWKHAESVGLKVMTTAEAAKAADIIMILTPDEKQASIYKKDIEPNLTAGKALAFAHGFNIHFKQIVPPSDVDVFMIAPKAPGHTVRSEYKEGKGTPCLVAVYQDATGHCEDIALAYGAGIGGALMAQIAVNVGMNLRVLPVIGVTLPFYSAGGSSVLMLYICVGLVLSVYSHNTKSLFS